MFEKRIQVGEGESLTLVEMASNVAVTTWDEPDVLIRLHDGDGEHLTVEQTETGPAVSARLGCSVLVPGTLPIKIREVSANLKAEGVSELDAEQVRGHLTLSGVQKVSLAEVYGHLRAVDTPSLSVVGTVFGNATLKGVAAADLQNVRGTLQAKAINHLRAGRIGGSLQVKEMGGALDVDQVGGNAVLKGIGGAVTLDQVAGNLVAKNLSGGAKVPKIGGNLALNGEIGTGCTYHFKARGNATLRLPEEASVHLTLSAKGRIRSSVALADQMEEENRLTGTLGDGGAEIAVEAGGNILLGGGGAEVRIEIGPEAAEEISRQIEEGLAAIDLERIGRQVGEEMDAALSRLQVKLESVDWERVGVQTQEAVERAMEQMRRNMDRMVDKAARHQERLERRVERQKRRVERHELRRKHAQERQYAVDVQLQDWSDEEVEPAEPGPDLDEERLSILRMVEQGQITPEEAEMLLDALQD